MTNPINDANVNDDIVNEATREFAAVPIHFRPGEGKSKLIKLVIPGIEPPLGFFEVSGGTPDELKLEQTDGPAMSSGDDDGVEIEVEQTEGSHPSPEDKSQDESTDSDEETLPEEESEEELSYPHEDSAGDPVAGFLLGSEEHQPLVILVRPAKGQTAQEAMEEESAKHPEHIPGSLEEAKKLLGHDPLTSEDN